MYSAFISVDHITPIFKMIPAIFAKSSLFIAPSYYLLSNRNLLKNLCITSTSPNDRVILLKENLNKKQLLNTENVLNEKHDKAESF